jgi:hypothetical protein
VKTMVVVLKETTIALAVVVVETITKTNFSLK